MAASAPSVDTNVELEHAYDQPLAMRAFVLLLASLVSLGSNYCYHNPAALKNQLQQHFIENLSKNEFEVLFNMLYSLYALPNIVLPFFGGLLVDKLGPRSMLLILTSLVLAGQSILAFGSSISSFKIMLIGRIIYGIGGESLGVARSTFISTWFRKQELALALGIGSSFSGLASILNNVLSPSIAETLGVSSAIWLGAFFCAGSVCATCILIPVDQKAKQKRNTNGNPLDFPLQSVKKKNVVKITDVKHFGRIFWMALLAQVAMWAAIVPFTTAAGSLLLERDFFRRPSDECYRCGEGNYASYTDCHEIVPTCPSNPPFAWPLPQLNKNCKLVRSIDQLYCSSEPPFIDDSEINCDNEVWKNGVVTRLYCQKKIAAEKQAARVMSIPPIMSMVAAPVFGYIVDHVGNRAALAWGSASIVAIVHLLIATSRIPIMKLLFAFGLATCLFFTSLWPSIPYIVEEHHIGSAYGAVVALANFGLAIIPVVVSTVYRLNGSYLPSVELLLFGLAVFAFICCLVLDHLNRQCGNVLNNPKPQVVSVSSAVPRYNSTQPAPSASVSSWTSRRSGSQSRILEEEKKMLLLHED